MGMTLSEIDTRFGTANDPDFSHGNCLPVTALPFAMNHFVPQTNGNMLERFICVFGISPDPQVIDKLFKELILFTARAA